MLLPWAELHGFRNNISSTNVNGTSFTNTENFNLRNNRQGLDANIELNYTPTNNQSLVAETQYIYGRQLDRTNIRFNGIASNENLNHTRSLFDQKITFTHKPAPRKAWIYTGRLKHETRPQTYRYDDFLLDDLFGVNNERLHQTVDTRMLFFGAEARRLHRMNNGDLWEMRVGNAHRSDALQSAFSLQDNGGQNTFPLPYQNNFSYAVNDLFIKNSYQKKLGKLSLNADLDLHQFFNQINNKIVNEASIQNQNQTQNETLFFINPKLGVRWDLSDKNKLSASYSFATRNAESAQVLPNFVLTNYRNFRRGTNAFDQLASSSWSFTHRYGNFRDRFLSSTSIVFTKNHDFFSTNSFVTQNFTQAQYQLFRDRETVFINTKLDYYFKSIATNLKLDLGCNLSNYANIVNNSPVRNVRSAQYTYGLELRSGFDGFFNFNAGTKWRRNTIRAGIENSFTNNLSFLDLTFLLSERLDFQIQSERYHFGNLTRTPNYYFLDLQARYAFKNKKLNLSLRGKNLFNTQTFRNFSISDIGVSTTAFDLLPRFLLLKLEYRFGQRPSTEF